MLNSSRWRSITETSLIWTPPSKGVFLKTSLDYLRLSAIIESNERNSKMNGYLYDDETDENVTMLFFPSWVEEINS